MKNSQSSKIILKESEKKDKYLVLARESKKKLWNMKVMIMLIVIGAPNWYKD